MLVLQDYDKSSKNTCGGNIKMRKAIFSTCNWTGLAFLLLTCSVSTTAFAQDQDSNVLEEVIVTATKRGAVSSQDLAFSVSAVTGDQLSNLGATGIEDISGLVPGFTAINAGANQKKLRIRGISSSAESEPQETVSVYLDHVPIIDEDNLRVDYRTLIKEAIDLGYESAAEVGRHARYFSVGRKVGVAQVFEFDDVGGCVAEGF